MTHRLVMDSGASGTHPTGLDEMLPDKWAVNQPEAVLTYRLEESRRKAAARSSRRRHPRANRQPS